jgi:hypothetical protein
MRHTGLVDHKGLGTTSHRRRSQLPIGQPAVLFGACLLLVASCSAGVPSAARAPTTTGVSHAGGPLPCPGAYSIDAPGRPYGGWVPAAPSITTGGRLSPAETPDSVIVCAYREATPVTPARTVLRGDLRVVTAQLANLAQRTTADGCLAYLASSDSQNYLIGLRFGSDVVWVSAPGDHCLGSTNGRDDSPVNLRADAQQAYRTGYWDSDPAVTAPCAAAATRDGHSEPLVPDGASRVTICQGSPGGPVRAYEYADSQPTLTGGNSLTSLLKPYAADLAPIGCTGSTSNGGLLLIFSYPTRADVNLAATPTCTNHLAVSKSSDDLITNVEFFWIERV